MPNVVPYNFVPLGNGKRKVTPVDPYDRNLLHGSISCTLKTVTPLFIPNTTGDMFFEDDESRFRIFHSRKILNKKPDRNTLDPAIPIIPGSSIRGILRSVFEVASNSCLRVAVYNPNKREKDTARRLNMTAAADVPDKYQPCLGLKNDKEIDICPACSLFGMIGTKRSYGGRIRVADAEGRRNIRYDTKCIPGQYSPSFLMFTKVICNENNEIKGRKFYWHHKPRYISKEDGKDTIRAIEPGAEFDFEIFFDGITKDELKQLAAVIRLDGCGMHKLGAAKPLGFGSVQMDIETITIRKLDPVKNGILYQNCVETDKYKNVTMQEAFGNQDNHLDDLMNILRFEAVSDQNIAYPPTRTGGFNAGNAQRFIRGSIQDVVRQIQDIRTQEQRRREQMERERAEREAEEQRRMQESASDEDWQRLAARFRRR